MTINNLTYPVNIPISLAEQRTAIYVILRELLPEADIQVHPTHLSVQIINSADGYRIIRAMADAGWYDVKIRKGMLTPEFYVRVMLNPEAKQAQ